MVDDDRVLGNLRGSDNISALIPIDVSGGQQLVSARDLHWYLQVGRDFSTWLKARIEQYGFVEGEDYITTEGFSPDLGKTKSGRPTIEYGLTMDMAKELAMVENNDLGRQARRYFIRVEKEYRKGVHRLPQTFAEALRLAADQEEARLEAERQLAIVAPKADAFTYTIEGMKNKEMRMAAVAALLNHPELGLINLFRFLRDQKILKDDKPNLLEHNTPYRRYSKYFRVVMKRCGTRSSEDLRAVPLVNPDGLVYIIKRILEVKGPWGAQPTPEELTGALEMAEDGVEVFVVSGESVPEYTARKVE